MRKLLIITILAITITACKTKKEAAQPTAYAFVIPGAFSPNGDGKNETACFITPKQTAVIKGTISLYNRWGELLWESKDLNNCWDGINPKTKTTYPQGVYMVKITQNGVEKISGAITLLK